MPSDTKVSDGGQPLVTFDLFLRESADSRSLHRLVRHSFRAETAPDRDSRFD